MPIVPPRLDDRGYEDLVEELLARVPAHTPEWHPRPEGDPGRTLLELFAWLADNILYRANLLPERQRLAFLRLLDMPLQPARPARGLVALVQDTERPLQALSLAPGARVSGPVDFETLHETRILPVSGECYYKRRLDARERRELAEVIDGLRRFYQVEGEVSAYATTPVFGEAGALPGGLDLVADTADRSLWIALLAARPEDVPEVKAALAGDGAGGGAIDIGLAPATALPESLEELPPGDAVDHGWWIGTAELDEAGQPLYRPLQRLRDGTGGLARRGVQRLALPGDVRDFGVLEGDPASDVNAGVGDRPPRLDDPERLARLVAWLRLRPAQGVGGLRLAWAGINAAEIDQCRTLRDRVVGQSDGRADQEIALGATSVQPQDLQVEVEEAGRGYVAWRRVDDLLLYGRDDPVFRLDPEAGTLRFGDGIHGRIPEAGRRIRVAFMRAGGGAAGNLPPGSLQAVEGEGPDGRPLARPLRLLQPLATVGGADAETLEQAERRIPARLGHRNRAVTGDDFAALAREALGDELGRVEVLPRFLPRQRRFEVPGVVSVMVLPHRSGLEPPNPRPDQPLIRRLFDYLTPRRPLATELYVIGCEYVPLGLSVGIGVREGFGREQVAEAVRQALRAWLWSLPPHGPAGAGWPLGRAVGDRELEVAAARVPGVAEVGGVELFRRRDSRWERLPRPQACGPVSLELEPWQLPELLAVAVGADGVPPEHPGEIGPAQGDGGIALPVVPELC